MNLPLKKRVATLVTAIAFSIIILVHLSFNIPNHSEPLKWYGNDHFRIAQEDDVVKIRMSKMPWESFSTDIQPLESAEGFLSFEVKSEQPITLRVDGLTNDKKQVELFKENIDGSDYHNLLYQLSSAEGKISHLIFYVNPGDTFHGEIYIRGLAMKPFDEEENLSVFPNPTVGDALVQLPHMNFSSVILYDESGNVVMMKEPEGSRSVKLDLNDRKAGLYVLKARSSSNEMLTTKVVVKR